jgi:dihydroflavonol-4-reductase
MHYLVTGASGYVAMHLILLLLSRGHRVRGTLRRMERADALVEALGRHVETVGCLELVPAELERSEGWAAAVQGMDGVFHVASPVPRKAPLLDRYFVEPALQGTMQVLQAARFARVPRVVLTSSVAAIGSGHPSRREPFTEDDWSRIETAPPYEKSKTVAERAAWEWVRAHEDAPELVAVNPSFVFGPVLWSECSPSLEVIELLLSGRLPGIPDLHFGVVDVRDVAQAHYLAMTRPEAAGKRFICHAGSLSLEQIADELRAFVAPRGVRVPTRRIPDWVIRVGALFSPTLRYIAPRLGHRREYDTSGLRALGWQPRALTTTLHETAESLLEVRRMLFRFQQ